MIANDGEMEEAEFVNIVRVVKVVKVKMENENQSNFGTHNKVNDRK